MRTELPRTRSVLLVVALVCAILGLGSTYGESTYRHDDIFRPPLRPAPPPTTPFRGVGLTAHDPGAAAELASLIAIGTRSCGKASGWWRVDALVGRSALVIQDHGFPPLTTGSRRSSAASSICPCSAHGRAR